MVIRSRCPAGAKHAHWLPPNGAKRVAGNLLPAHDIGGAASAHDFGHGDEGGPKSDRTYGILSDRRRNPVRTGLAAAIT